MTNERCSAPLDDPAAPSGERGDSARIVLCERRQFDLSDVAVGNWLNTVIARLPCERFASATLVVKVHELALSTGTELRIIAVHTSISETDPRIEFLPDGSAAEIVLTSTDEAPALLLQPLEGPLGTHVAVAVEGRRNVVDPVTLTATLSIELVLRSAPASASTAAYTDVEQTWTATQTFDGDGTDTDAAIVVAVNPTNRKLAWELHGGSAKLRLYYTDNRIELTVNARWTGTQWERDSTGIFAARYLLERNDFRIQHVVTAIAQPFNDADWAGSSAKVFAWDIDSIGTGETLTTSRERDVPSGPLTGYSAVNSHWGSTVNIGAGASFASGRLPSAPSSVTFTVHSQLGTGNSPSSFAVQRMGVGWFDSTTGTGQRYMYLSFSAT